MADCHRANIMHLTGVPKLGVALASVSKEKSKTFREYF